MITSFTATRISDLAWRLAWASDDPAAEFRVFRNGLLIDQTTDTSLVVAVEPGDSPVFEVLDDPDATAVDANPDRATLAWYAAAATREYRVDQYDGAAWNEVARVADDGGGYFTWQSDRLADGVVAQFRVVPLGINGNAGTPQAFSILIVRYPDVPEVSYSYNSGTGVVTVSAA